MKVKLTDRDLSLLKSLWKWKLLGTTTLSLKYFSDRSPITAYKRLWMLKEAGFIQVLTDESQTLRVWGLTSRGFGVVQEHFDHEPKENGFASETIRHDFLVSAIHWGDWLQIAPQGCQTFSEQQLRRYQPTNYPAWVPKSFLHRPDGYWHVQRGEVKTTVALEVELARKKDAKYEILAERYEAESQIFRVVWVVPNKAFAHYVWQRINNAVKDKSGIHDFITLEDYRKSGWQTLFLLGYESGKSLKFLLENQKETSPKPVSALFLLDGRLCPHKSKVSVAPKKPCPSNRVTADASKDIEYEICSGNHQSRNKNT